MVTISHRMIFGSLLFIRGTIKCLGYWYRNVIVNWKQIRFSCYCEYNTANFCLVDLSGVMILRCAHCLPQGEFKVYLILRRIRKQWNAKNGLLGLKTRLLAFRVITFVNWTQRAVEIKVLVAFLCCWSHEPLLIVWQLLEWLILQSWNESYNDASFIVVLKRERICFVWSWESW